MVTLVFASIKFSGLCPSAFAAAVNTPGAAGEIAGSFFTDDPITPQMSSSLATVRPVLPVAIQAADPCGPAIASAGSSHNLPAGLLNAIAVVESGRLDAQSGRVEPWPWTIDANGTGTLYSNEQAALRAAAGFEAAGITSLDIGCLQVNLAQHPDAFQSLAQAFDPAANANYAATFLTSLKQKLGSWPAAIAAYHSQTPALGTPYAARVYAQWQGGGQGGAAPLAMAGNSLANSPADGAIRIPPSPLPQTAFAMSSLIPPMQMLNRPNSAMTGRSLASYRATPITIANSQPPPG